MKTTVSLGLWELKKIIKEMEENEIDVLNLEIEENHGILKRKGIETMNADGPFDVLVFTNKK